MTNIERFFLGFGFVLSGLDFMRTAGGLRRWAMIPLLISLCLFGVGVYFGAQLITWATTKALLFVLAPEHGLYPILYYPLQIVFWVVFLGLLVYVLYLIAGMIASPFNSILAEKTLVKLGAKKEEPFNLRKTVSLAFRMFRISVIRSLILLCIGFAVFLASFIPGLNFFAVFFAFLIISFDGADYSFEVLEMGLGERFRFLRQNFAEFCGMATFVGLTLLIPGLILLVMPAAVVGSAIVIHRIRERGSHGSGSDSSKNR